MAEQDTDSPLPEATRSQVARDMMVFQAKLFVDGFKDLVMSPLSIGAGLLGLLFSRGNPGKPLYEVMRFGKRLESWINLFSAAYTRKPLDERTQPVESTTHNPSDQPVETVRAIELGDDHTEPESPRDLDALVDQLQATLLDPEARSRLSERSKNQLNQVTRRLLKDRPSELD